MCHVSSTSRDSWCVGEVLCSGAKRSVSGRVTRKSACWAAPPICQCRPQPCPRSHLLQITKPAEEAGWLAPEPSEGCRRAVAGAQGRGLVRSGHGAMCPPGDQEGREGLWKRLMGKAGEPGFLSSVTRLPWDLVQVMSFPQAPVFSLVHEVIGQNRVYGLFQLYCIFQLQISGFLTRSPVLL